MQNILKIR